LGAYDPHGSCWHPVYYSLPRACLQPEMRATAVAPTKTQIRQYVHIYALLPPPSVDPNGTPKRPRVPVIAVLCLIVGLACTVGIIFVTEIPVKTRSPGGCMYHVCICIWLFLKIITIKLKGYLPVPVHARYSYSKKRSARCHSQGRAAGLTSILPTSIVAAAGILKCILNI
jgi:hypothetical protein